jgi:hypothetical protein
MTDFREWPASMPLPKVLGDRDLMELLGIGHSTYCRRKKAGGYRFLEADRQFPNGHTVYSGAKIDRWLSGDPSAASSSRRFFPNAPKSRSGRRTTTMSHDRQSGSAIPEPSTQTLGEGR